MSKKWDFSGWATKTDMRCSDGRTIKKGAFSGCNGVEVPLVWNHRHNDPSEVLGHALLEERDGGMYAYCSFNDSEKGQEAKELVRHGDIKSLSIYANQLIQSSKTPPCDVIHGTIREVSLVLAGANPGAFIDNVMVHGEIFDDEAEIFHDDEDDGLYLYHADDDEEDEVAESNKEKTVGDVLETLNEEQKAAVGVLIDQVLKDNNIKHADDEEDDDPDETLGDIMDTLTPKQRRAVEAIVGMAISEGSSMQHADDEEDDDPDETIGDVLNSLTPKQRKVVEAIVGMAISENGGSMQHADDEDDDDPDATIGDVLDTLNPRQRKAVEALVGLALSEKDNDSDEEDDSDMKHNVFDSYEYGPYLSHADEQEVLELAQKTGSLKVAFEQSLNDGVLAHAITDHNGNSVTYGIANADYFFPDAKAISDEPDLIANDETWVDKVINGTHHTPFSRVKSLAANLTGEDARARGYVKGNQKISQVLEALARETTPQTIYKLQKMDRDDILDITTFNVVAWIKAELKRQLRAEIARAILIGDGRPATGDVSKIKEINVRPIYNDNDTYTVKVPVAVAANATDADIAAAMIDAIILSRKDYKGSGNPSFFVDENWLGQMLILKDGMGRRIYETEASLAAAIRVKEIIPVDVMENQTITISSASKPLIGIIVNLQDYNVGADRGGEVSFFEDFDINYNKNEYLVETRMSGALVKPYSAMSIYVNRAS